MPSRREKRSSSLVEGKPVGRLTGSAEKAAIPHRLGTLKGTVTYMAPDFDASLEDFKEYME